MSKFELEPKRESKDRKSSSARETQMSVRGSKHTKGGVTELVLIFTSPPGGEIDPDGALANSLPLSDFILADVLTTKGDLLGDNGVGPTRVPVGPNGSVLTADSATSTGLTYTSLGPKGSILAAESTTLIGGFPVGTDGQILISESSQTFGLEWVNASSVIPALPSLGAQFVQTVQGANISVASGLAFDLVTGSLYPTGTFNTAGITFGGAPTQGTYFHLPPGNWMIDFETSMSSVGPIAMSTGTASTGPYTPYIASKAGSTTATTWVHGRTIYSAAQVATAPFVIFGPTDSVAAAVVTTGGAPQYIVRVTFQQF
jgi:hypothetical protein